MKILKKVLDGLFSTSAAGLYILLFALAIAVATFIENDFGTSSAQKLIFKTHWFEGLLILFGGAVITNIFRFRMIQQKKWAILAFHASFIIILIGAGVTRYIGSEGMMGIREGATSNTFLSTETYLQFRFAKDGKTFAFDEPVFFAALGKNKFRESYLIDGQKLNVELLNFMPNPKETLVEDKNGVPILKVVIAGSNGREEYLVKYKDRVSIYGTLFNFGNPEEAGAFNIQYERDSLYFRTDQAFTQMVMATQTMDTIPAGTYSPLRLRSMYSNGTQSFVFGDFVSSGRSSVVSTGIKMTSTSLGGLQLRVQWANQSQELFITGLSGVEGQPGQLAFGDATLSVAYGAKRITLPFSLKLNDFIMERYPGTNSASSYASEVTLLDSRNDLVRDQRIYMNHILNYGGYRFFQSSFDQDELGTYLSVNHDAPGTIISYIGYIILTLGMILTLFSQTSRFQDLSRKIQKLRASSNTLTMLLLLGGLTLPVAVQAAPESGAPAQVIDREHAKAFGRLLMQDHNGRTKPMNTFCSEVVRKLSRKEELFGQIPEQIVLGMMANPEAWYVVPMIKVGKDPEVQKLLNTNQSLISYRDFFDEAGSYRIAAQVEAAYNAQPRDRGNFEKELLKLDEKVNICNMIFMGSFLSVFPIPGDPNNHWRAPNEDHQHNDETAPAAIVEQFHPVYVSALQGAMRDNDWKLTNRVLEELSAYQQRNGGAVLPAPAKIKAELWLNALNVFSRLGKLYGLLGLVFLTLLFTGVFKTNLNLKIPFLITFGLLVLGFALHTFGLGLRWYVSGRAPWSNGYESMIYIAWTTVLAGLIFTRKSAGGLAATTVLSSTILMVAGLSWLDPEITPLVPVLKSYWLTIHVSLIAGSYGFLSLGALIGIINLIFMILATKQNGPQAYRIIKELSWISEMTLIGGLFMISIGTYLGGVWANESWGRYWGWDAKETWALVTILVYSFILHMRFIPGLRGVYAFNVSTLFGLASVIMTYFGVNYYLSGLHSYAAGDPVPIPTFVYYTVAILLVISLLAFWRHRVYTKDNPGSAFVG